VAIVAGALFWRPALAAACANLGSLAQSRVELSRYDQRHFADLTLEQVRQQNDLDAALAWFGRAVEIDPANPTARLRQSEVALARGQYAEALAQAQAAWDAGHRDSVTRLVYGDALAANGRPEDAAQAARGVQFAATRFAGFGWSRYYRFGDYRRAADSYAAAFLLNPENTGMAEARDEAARKAEGE
jgi:tetratricopeptide (TPR) repeat protein